MTEVRRAVCADVCLWPDGTWCFWEDVEEYGWMSDDYEVIAWDSPRAKAIVDG